MGQLCIPQSWMVILWEPHPKATWKRAAQLHLVKSSSFKSSSGCKGRKGSIGSIWSLKSIKAGTCAQLSALAPDALGWHRLKQYKEVPMELVQWIQRGAKSIHHISYISSVLQQLRTKSLFSYIVFLHGSYDVVWFPNCLTPLAHLAGCEQCWPLQGFHSLHSLHGLHSLHSPQGLHSEGCGWCFFAQRWLTSGDQAWTAQLRDGDCHAICLPFLSNLARQPVNWVQVPEVDPLASSKSWCIHQNAVYRCLHHHPHDHRPYPMPQNHERRSFCIGHKLFCSFTLSFCSHLTKLFHTFKGFYGQIPTQNHAKYPEISHIQDGVKNIPRSKDHKGSEYSIV